MIELRCDGWRSGPVVLATGFWQRFRGIKSVAPGTGLLIQTRSVHTFGVRQPLGVVSLSSDRIVLTVQRVEPRCVIAASGACEYLELPEQRALPPVGRRLEVRPIVTP